MRCGTPWLKNWKKSHTSIEKERKRYLSFTNWYQYSKIFLPTYYSEEWPNSAPNRVPPNGDLKISQERNKWLRRYFPNNENVAIVNEELSRFLECCYEFASLDSLQDRWTMNLKGLRLCNRPFVLLLQSLALKLLGQPSSSSCERNWSTYSFIHSSLRDKMLWRCAEDLVYIDSNYYNDMRKIWCTCWPKGPSL